MKLDSNSLKCKRWRQRNREYVSAYNRKWRKEHPDQVKANNDFWNKEYRRREIKLGRRYWKLAKELPEYKIQQRLDEELLIMDEESRRRRK